MKTESRGTTRAHWYDGCPGLRRLCCSFGLPLTGFLSLFRQVMVQELLKLSISLHGLSQVPDGFRELMSFPLTQWLKFGVPGLLYCINNNLFHHVRH